MSVVDIDAAVIANRRLSDEYNIIELQADAIAARSKPGQFVMIKGTPGSDPLLRRPFSIFQILRDTAHQPTGISILNKRVGVGTRLLYAVDAGATITCLGPLGRAFEPVDPPAEAWMIAGGVGLAPFVTLTSALSARGTRMRLFYGGRRASDLFCLDLFQSHGVEIVLTTEDGSRGERGRVTAPLDRALRNTNHPVSPMLYACGPTPMLRAVATLAAASDCRCVVSLEQTMGCGLGGCYSCVVPIRGASGSNRYLRSCIEGPVFDAARVDWSALTH